MFKLQSKLVLYNALTKASIVLICGILFVVFIDDISNNQLDYRLIDKAKNLIKNLSEADVSKKIMSQKNFTDYNILREEYIFLEELPLSSKILKTPEYKTEYKVVDKETAEYRIIEYPFIYNKKLYKLEIGQKSIVIVRIKKTISIISFFTVFITLGISLVLDIFFNRILLKPFYKIVDQKIKKVNDPLSYNHNLIPTTTKDFRSLDVSISELMNKISNLILKEKQFIANVSHELLTPISILRVRLENILNDDNLQDHDSKKIYDSIKTLNRLKNVVNSLLLISKIENQQFNKPDKFSISEVVEEVILELEDRMEIKEINLKKNLKNNFSFEGNESLIHTLFFNIVNNAIKYNHKEGSIIIKDKTSNEFYYVYVIDTGFGMDKQGIENAFNRFEKLENEHDESHGLGLSIVKSIAQFHKINIEIQSEVGEGSTFILRFPNQLLS